MQEHHKITDRNLKNKFSGEDVERSTNRDLCTVLDGDADVDILLFVSNRTIRSEDGNSRRRLTRHARQTQILTFVAAHVHGDGDHDATDDFESDISGQSADNPTSVISTPSNTGLFFVTDCNITF